MPIKLQANSAPSIPFSEANTNPASAEIATKKVISGLVNENQSRQETATERLIAVVALAEASTSMWFKSVLKSIGLADSRPLGGNIEGHTANPRQCFSDMHVSIEGIIRWWRLL